VRAVVQRVRSASVRVDGEVVGAIETGLLALVGVARGDGPEAAREIARKLVHLRVFADETGRMNLDLRAAGGALAVVSQFTLLGDARRGRRPSWSEAAAPAVAAPLVEEVAAEARRAGVRVVTGRFGAHMEVALVNDGPVTVLLDTEGRF